MNSIQASEAREMLDILLDEAATETLPILITGTRSNAVLISEDNWNSIQETLHLLSISGMRESIARGLATPLDHCTHEPGW